MRDTSWLAASRTRSAWLFLAPMLVLLALVAGWPLIRTIWLGFTDANTLQLGETRSVGFDNFLSHRGGHSYMMRKPALFDEAMQQTADFLGQHGLPVAARTE